MHASPSPRPPQSARRPPATAAVEGARFDAVRGASLALAAPLSDEDCALQSMPDASPVKWHLAHTSWFFETFLLAPSLPGYAAVRRRVPRALQFVLQRRRRRAIRGRERGLLSRPDLATVLAYRAHVDRAMHDAPRPPDPPPRRAISIELGIHHEQQHQELILTDVKHLLSRNPQQPVIPRGLAAGRRSRPRALAWHRHHGGVATIGHAGDGFAFDNEAPRHRVIRRAFRARVAAGHAWRVRRFHRGRRLSPSGAVAVARLGRRAYARAGRRRSTGQRNDGAWRTFTLHGMAEIDPHAPVCHVSLLRGGRVCALGRRAAADRVRVGSRGARRAHRGQLRRERRVASGGVGGRGAARCAGTAVRRRVGMDVQSSYGAYPGYRPAAGAVGEYNGKFMCNQYVLRGGSLRHAARRTSVRPIAISSRRTRAGSSRGCASHATPRRHRSHGDTRFRRRSRRQSRARRPASSARARIRLTAAAP